MSQYWSSDVAKRHNIDSKVANAVHAIGQAFNCSLTKNGSIMKLAVIRKDTKIQYNWKGNMGD